MKNGRIERCPSCGRANRIAWARLGHAARCGACKTPLTSSGTPIELAEGELDALVAESALPVFVDFWAAWCGPCRVVAPEVHKLAQHASGRFVVVKVDTERAPATAARHRVRSIPMFALFVGGREIARTAGARPAAALEQFIEQAIAPRKTG